MANTIYKIIDPRDFKVRYIGATTLTAHQRLVRHIYKAKTNVGTSKFYIWLRELLAAGYKPIITEITTTEKVQDLHEQELAYIAAFKYYHPLLNTYSIN